MLVTQAVLESVNENIFKPYLSGLLTIYILKLNLPRKAHSISSSVAYSPIQYDALQFLTISTNSLTGAILSNLPLWRHYHIRFSKTRKHGGNVYPHFSWKYRDFKPICCPQFTEVYLFLCVTPAIYNRQMLVLATIRLNFWSSINLANFLKAIELPQRQVCVQIMLPSTYISCPLLFFQFGAISCYKVCFSSPRNIICVHFIVI